MFTKEQIELAHSKVRSGEDFPAYVQELIRMGVKSHEVVLDEGLWIFRGRDGQRIQFKEGPENIRISDMSSAENFKTILTDHQHGKTDYAAFCIQAGECGIQRWLSDFKAMTVAYMDMQGNTVDVEPIPSGSKSFAKAIIEHVLNDGKTLIIRTPKESDAQGLIDLMQRVDGETKFLAREPGEFSVTLEGEQEFIKNANTGSDSRFFVAEIDGKIIGNCSVGRVLNQKRYRHRAALGIVVCRDYWGKGVGRIMMQDCIQWCRENEIEQVELEVVTENSRALSMYESLGFKIHGTKKHALKYADGSYANEYCMCLFL